VATDRFRMRASRAIKSTAHRSLPSLVSSGPQLSRNSRFPMSSTRRCTGLNSDNQKADSEKRLPTEA